MDKCPVCLLDAEVTYHGGPYHFTCARCGNFEITQEAKDVLLRLKPTKELRAHISGWLNENQPFKVTSRSVEALLNSRRLSLTDRAERLLFYWLKPIHLLEVQSRLISTELAMR